jgi:hypothetical protein
VGVVVAAAEEVDAAAVVVVVHAVAAVLRAVVVEVAVRREVLLREVVEDIAEVAAAAAQARAAHLRCRALQIGHHRSAGQAVGHLQAHGPVMETCRLPVVALRQASAIGPAEVTLPVDLVVLAQVKVAAIAPASVRARVPETYRAAEVGPRVEICKTSSIFRAAAWQAEVGRRRDPQIPAEDFQVALSRAARWRVELPQSS